MESKNGAPFSFVRLLTIFTLLKIVLFVSLLTYAVLTSFPTNILTIGLIGISWISSYNRNQTVVKLYGITLIVMSILITLLYR